MRRRTFGLDFAAGFYLTTSEEQARRFSGIVAKRRKSGIVCLKSPAALLLLRFIGAYNRDEREVE